jgi:hypothetical protein
LANYTAVDNMSTIYAPIDSPVFTGNVAIGIAVANQKLEVSGANNIYTQTSTTGVDSIVGFSLVNDARSWVTRVNGTDSDKFQIRDATADVQRFIIDIAGNFGINGGLHIGGESAVGDNNLLVDGTCNITGISTFTGLIKTVGGVHVGGTSDPGTDNILVDGYVKSDELNGITAYTDGFAGTGYKLNKSGSDYSLTVDNLTVRKMMKIYELEIDKIKSVNGGIMVSIANGKAYSVNSNILEFTSWTNLSYETFVSSGLNVSSAINISEQAIAYLNTYTTIDEEVIIFNITLTLNSGTAPKIYIGVDQYLLSAGVNVVTHTVITGGAIQPYLRIDTSTASDFSISDVSITSSIQRIYFDEDGTNKQIQFAVNDYIRAQEWSGRGIDAYLGKVLGVTHSSTLGSAYIRAISDNICWINADLVQVGSSSDTARQNMIYITAADTNNPFIDILSGVTDGDFAGHTKVRLGNLTGITDSSFGALSGYGLYSSNAYLTGSLFLPTAGMINEGSSASSVRIYAGDTYANRANADFIVTQDGSLTAKGNCILGSVSGTVSLGQFSDVGVIEVYSTLKNYGAIEHQGYSVQSNLELHTIAYSLYYLDAADVAKTLWLPASSEFPNSGTTIILLNPTKGNFTINGNGEDIYLSTDIPVTFFVLGFGESTTLIYKYGGTAYPGWYEL